VGKTGKGTDTIAYNGPSQEKALLKTIGGKLGYSAVVRDCVEAGIAQLFPAHLAALKEIRERYRADKQMRAMDAAPKRLANIRKAHEANRARGKTNSIEDSTSTAKNFLGLKNDPIAGPPPGQSTPDNQKGKPKSPRGASFRGRRGKK
jgi:hypothetical protein